MASPKQLSVFGAFGFLLASSFLVFSSTSSPSPIRFAFKQIPFHLESDEGPSRNAPETMAGGVAVFDFNQDGRADIFFTNGASIVSLKKDSAKYRNRLFRNDGNGVFTDVTDAAGLAGTGYDIGVAVGDYDNDGFPDLFVAGLHHSTLYHNNGNGTFTDVSDRAGLNRPDPEYGAHWGITGGWVDVNNDGLLDLVIINYVQWAYRADPLCTYEGRADYCHPRVYKGQPNQLFLNKGGGVFEDVSAKWGLREHVGKGMGVGIADYDLDGKPDLFVPNDAGYNFLFHNKGDKFEEVAFDLNTALAEDGNFISGMGLDFRDMNNDGYPDIVYIALNNQTFPLLQNMAGREFKEITTSSGVRALSLPMAGFGAGFYDFDNDGWKDFFVTRGHVSSMDPPGSAVNQLNSVFHNPGATGKWQAFTEDAGLNGAPAARHRGSAFGDFDGDGKVDIVTTAISADAEIWMNRSEGAGHWLDVLLKGTKSNRDGIGARLKLVSKAGMQYNHMTTSVGYASSSDGPVHFGMGSAAKADLLEVRWPSGIVQTLTNIAADRVLTLKEPAR